MIKTRSFGAVTSERSAAHSWIGGSGAARVFFFFLALACPLVISKTARADGDLTVYLRPPEITGGANPAQFMVSPSNTWQNDGYTMLNLLAGPHTVTFSTYPLYYTPAVTSVLIEATDFAITNTYLPWTNYFSVDVQTDGGQDLTNATWSLSSKPSSFTNYTSGTGDLSGVLCPTGSYTIVYGSVAGYAIPAQFTTNLVGARPAAFTGIYTQAKGNINIIMNPTNGIWQFIVYPDTPAITNFTSDALSGTGTALITNAPSGTYEIQYGSIPGYTAPANQTTNIVNFPHTFYGTYGAGLSLKVHVYQPGEIINSNYYGGIGTGTYSVSGAAGTFDNNETWMFAAGSVVTLTANPSNMVIGTLTNNSFFFEWGGDTNSTASSLTVIMTTNKNVTLLFSREYESYDNAGDLDYDRLPDEWERKWGLDPKSDKGDNGRTGNSDGDYIASSSTNPPAVYSFTTNSVASYAGTNSTTPGYPLNGLALGRGYRNTSSDTGVKFYNELECRGLDGYYKTNGPTGAVADDDPRTDPTLDDTDDDNMTDGWEYYFWYWRSASAFTNGISNSANLSWVRMSPCLDRQPGGTLADSDTDGDGFTDGEEHTGVGGYCTDPTHADTDGDGMDDYWEGYLYQSTTNVNPLFAADGTGNPDDDWYAIRTNLFVLIDGTQGTAFTNTVYHNTATNAVWVDVYTNSGGGRFDLYKDTIIVATAVMTNQMIGTNYAAGTVYYGMTSGLSAYLPGYPVWVDTNSDGSYSAGDIVLQNPLLKNVEAYKAAPALVWPGASSFEPLVAWDSSSLLIATQSVFDVETVTTNTPVAASLPYSSYQEYFGGDYLGRVSWDAGGRVIAENDDEYALTVNSYTDPDNVDTDGDGMPDGWELYVGLNPQDVADALLDGDGDKLANLLEWANATDPLSSVAATWPNKKAPTDPGVVVAPSPNDPHPADTDWDGATDADEAGPGTNPGSYDTDGDWMPDGWELYAGSDPNVSDWSEDPDNDGLINEEEMRTGYIPEWMWCDPSWRVSRRYTSGGASSFSNRVVDFETRYAMVWDPAVEGAGPYFMSPDFFSDPSFLYCNSVYTNLGELRTNFPASAAVVAWHTTLANEPDSDGDGMDDYWEFYHGLNPCKGEQNLMRPLDLRYHYNMLVGNVDADPNTSGFQVGLPGQPFDSLSEFITAYTNDHYIIADSIMSYGTYMVGPFNFGLELMDPDGDGLPNTDEYSYWSSTNSTETTALYHTDPTPFWITDPLTTDSIDYQYTWSGHWSHYFYGSGYDGWTRFDRTEGFDTDNDGVSDYAEVNNAAGENGSDPLDSRNPIRNRALHLNGANDFVRTIYSWYQYDAYETFCAEAWVNLDNPSSLANQVILEKAGLYDNPYDLGTQIVRANYRLGVTNGLPYILYNGKGAMTAYQATAQVAHRLQSGEWAHVAGVFDGTNLTIYVNGESSHSIYTTELPASGEGEYDEEQSLFSGNPQTVMVGARDLNPGVSLAGSATNHFGGYIDEVRAWYGARSIAQIKADKDRRFSWSEVESLPLYAYYTFDDVPDPDTEGIVPDGMATLDTTLKLHPTISWWSNLTSRSTVYTGSVGAAYNYIVMAEDHSRHVPRIPPLDDQIHVITTNTVEEGVTNETESLPDDYRNTTDPYTIYRDLYFFRGAKGAAVASWLSSLDPDDPDSTDSDGDGLPDWWEILHGLDPNDAAGDQGAWGDYDNDGLDNRAEYLAGTDPRCSDTDGDGIGDYDSRSGPGARTWGELYSDGDGMPDTWEMQYGLDPYKYDAHLDLDGDGWSNYSEYQAGTDPSSASSYPTPTVSGGISYAGTNTGTLRILAYQTNTMDGVPAASASGSTTNFSISGFKEGEVYLFGFLDCNGDGIWSAGEPCGVAQDQPVNLFWTGVDDVILGISDEYTGYGRFAWTTTSSDTNFVDVMINRISEAGAPTVLTRSVRSPRSYFHEWDYQLSEIYGLSTGTYQWWAGTQNGTFSVNWSTTFSKPELVYPRGATLIYARNQIGWTMDDESTAYHLQVFNSALQAVINYYFVAPYPDSSGVYWDYLPYDANELGNDTYYWRVAGYTPAGESEWSDLQSFTIDLSSDSSRWISGDVYYFGKAGATNIIVEAFDNAGFSGTADARITYSLSCTTNSLKTSFTLRGLQAKTYYVHAFADISPADNSGRNEVLDWWESEGFVKASTNDYKPEPLVLTNAFYVAETQIVIRDKDTDNDDLPDAWEMHYFGNLDQTGDMDYDGDGESNLEEYSLEALDTDPTKWDTDGDGLSDHYERLYDGSESYDPYHTLSNPSGGDLNPTVWDTDADAYSDGAELRRYHTDPIDPASYPWYLPECYDSFASPSDYDADGRSDLGVYDETSGTWYLLTWTGEFWDLAFGNSTTQPLLGDYDGDGAADFAVYEPAGGYWYIYTWAGQFIMLPFGDSETIPVPADYDIDGKTDFAVYYPAAGYWYIYTWQYEFTAFQFGSSAMTPVPGDYDADGKSDFAVFEPATGYWYIYTWAGNFYMLQFGNATTTPVPGDYDGDGKSDFAVFEPATGYWYIFSWTGGFFYGQFGWSDVIPVPGDYDGDGRTDLAVYYPAAGYWFIYCWSGQLYQGQFGWSAASPILQGR